MTYLPRYRETVTGVGAGSAVSKDASSVLQSIESDLKRYQQSVTIIGTSQDDANVRDDLVEIRTTIKNKLTTASTDIAQQKQTGTARERVALDKLSKQLKQQLDRYKQIVNDHDKRRATYPLQTPDYNTGGSQRYHSSQQTISLQVQEQNVDQREREAEELQALERDIVDLNEVFKDVAVMVNEQGEEINRIEANVDKATARVEQGNTQLERLRFMALAIDIMHVRDPSDEMRPKSQAKKIKTVALVKSNRRLQLCILITCIVIVIVIVLVIVIPIAATQS